MLRAVLLVASLIALAPAQNAPGTGVAPTPTFDSTPSDPAAIGFLRSKVDRRVYSLEGAGAASMEATVHATFEVTARDSKQKPAVIDATIGCDYATGATSRVPAPNLTTEQKALLQQVLGSADVAFSFLPSRNATGWIASFAQDGDLVRVDYKPRQKPSMLIHHWSEWYKADGTPTRRVVVSNRPAGDVVERISQEVALVHTEVDRQLLLQSHRPVATEGQPTYTFEYATQDGFHVLEKQTLEDAGWKLTIEYKTKVKKAAAK